MNKETIDLSADVVGRVLVVDDDARNRRLLSDILTARGHEVIEAAGGEEGLEAAATHNPDVILLDIMMPGMDGFRVCEELRSRPETSAISIIFITALVDRKDRLKGIDLGANDYLAKPIDSRDVVLRVRNAVRMKKLFDQLRQANEDLRKLEELRDKLVRWIVHDMKAPMGGISGHLELLLMDAEDRLTAEQVDYVREALSSTQRLLQMANLLLDISRLEENRMPLDVKPADLVKIAAEAASELAGLAKEKDVEIVMPSGTAVAPADSPTIRRVIENLLDNGIRCIQRGGKITLRAEGESGVLQFEVEDNGPGIPVQYHEKIFEKFGQVEMRDERKLYSTGLGLNFCKLVVEAHGGAIGVRSEEDKGSVFWFTLPLEPSPKQKETQ
jgi:signal transduction histidine kinase